MTLQNPGPTKALIKVEYLGSISLHLNFKNFRFRRTHHLSCRNNFMKNVCKSTGLAITL